MVNADAAKIIFKALVEEGLIENKQEIYTQISFSIDFSSKGSDNDDNISEEEVAAMLDVFRNNFSQSQGPLQ